MFVFIFRALFLFVLRCLEFTPTNACMKTGDGGIYAWGAGPSFLFWFCGFFFVDFVSSLLGSVFAFLFRFFDLKGMKESFDAANRGKEKEGKHFKYFGVSKG